MSYVKSAVLFFSDLATGGNSHKEYRAQIERKEEGYFVNFQYGRQGGTLATGTKTVEPVDLEEATYIFDRLVREKMNKGYVEPEAKAKTALPPPITFAVPTTGRTPFPIEDLTELSEESEVEAFLKSTKWWLQKKNDGEFRQIEKRADGTFIGYNKLGGVVTALPSEIVYELKKLRAKTFFMAGELMGNRFVAENLLEVGGEKLTGASYQTRWTKLELLLLANARHVTLTATWKTPFEKAEGWKALKASRAEGGCFKSIAAVYRSGHSGQHFKAKFTKTLSAIVIGKGHKGHNSATLGLHCGNKIIEVGRVSLNGKPHVEIGSVCEIRYLYASEGKRLYQPRLLKVRTDVDQADCVTEQLIFKEGVSA